MTLNNVFKVFTIVVAILLGLFGGMLSLLLLYTEIVLVRNGEWALDTSTTVALILFFVVASNSFFVLLSGVKELLNLINARRRSREIEYGIAGTANSADTGTPKDDLGKE